MVCVGSAILIGMKHLRTYVWKGAALVALILGASAANAADPQVEALLAKMRNAYRAAKSATYTTHSQVRGQAIDVAFVFKSPWEIRADVTIKGLTGKPIKAMEITTGKTTHMDLGGKPAGPDKPFKVDDFVNPLGVNLESICFFDWDRQLSTGPGKNMAQSTFKIMPNQDWNGKKWTVLEETAKTQKVVCKYFIDPKTSLIWRTTVKAMPGGPKNAEMDCQISKMSLNPKVDDSTFKIEHV